MYQKTVTVYEEIPINEIVFRNDRDKIAAEVINNYILSVREKLDVDEGASWDEVLVSCYHDALSDISETFEEEVYLQLNESIGIQRAIYFICRILGEGELKPLFDTGLCMWILLQLKIREKADYRIIETTMFEILDILKGKKEKRETNMVSMAEVMFEVAKNMHLKLKNRASEIGKNAVSQRYSMDKKQKIKEKVKNEWITIGQENRKRGYKAKFARNMLDKYPLLESYKVIEGWCRDWEKECKST